MGHVDGHQDLAAAGHHADTPRPLGAARGGEGEGPEVAGPLRCPENRGRGLRALTRHQAVFGWA
jgi:hypothetical protein